MQSLRDKLLKAGLVSEEAAKKVEAEKAAGPAPRRDERPRDERPRAERPAPASAPAAPASFRREAPHRTVRDERPAGPIPKLPPMAGSKEAHRQQSRRQAELDRSVREKVLAAQVTPEPGTTTFHFVTRKNKLRRLELSAAQAARLEAGELAVVERPDPDKIDHALVPAAAAEELLVLAPRAVRFLNKQGAQVGFLSEAELTARASESTLDAPEAHEAEPVAAGPAEPVAETFMTIKRAPR